MRYTANMRIREAYFAAGCFWGVQDYFDKVPGVVETEVGYAGGHIESPSYEQVCNGDTGHAETTKIVFEPETVDYSDLVRHFFRMHNPTQINRQGPDVGEQYRSAIFYTDDSQRTAAEEIKKELDAGGELEAPIATEITQLKNYYPAEEYHQHYTQKTGIGGCHIAFKPLE